MVFLLLEERLKKFAGVLSWLIVLPAYVATMCGACWGVEQLRNLCTAGITSLNTSGGLAFPLYAEKSTSPSIYVRYNNMVCYGDLEVGISAGAVNVAYNDVVYHLVAKASSGGGGTSGGDTGGGNIGGGDTGGDDTDDDIYKFFATTTSDTTSFEFTIGARGTFYIDWGDGDTEIIEKGGNHGLYSHTYDVADVYTIRIGGLASGYYSYAGDTSVNQAISFSGNTNLASVEGSLGEIFPTLSDGTQPDFSQTFAYCSELTSISENLFSGISGAPSKGMFSGTFYGCSGLTSIPDGLFAGITGAPADYVFANTFAECTGLTSIPAGLFAGINGAPATEMFAGTFYGCSGLTSIPVGLFAGINGAPAAGMFVATFEECSGLTGEIPLGLFGNITSVSAKSMFEATFYGCSGLTGLSARMPDGTFLYDYFDLATAVGMSFASMYYDCTGLDDYDSIPNAWK